MENFNRHQHWEQIYKTKKIDEVSWYQPTPATSLSFFETFQIDIHARIIDVGGGDSFLVDHLIARGYTDITVLDISETAIERCKARLGEKAAQVHWIVADAATFKATRQYDFWHDRAAFHFLTSEHEIDHYLHTVQQSLSDNGILVIGTFSEDGPTKCSGITIHQYSEKTMTERLQQFFEKIKCITTDHVTPFNTIQHFIFCSFRKPHIAG